MLPPQRVMIENSCHIHCIHIFTSKSNEQKRQNKYHTIHIHILWSLMGIYVQLFLYLLINQFGYNKFTYLNVNIYIIFVLPNSDTYTTYNFYLQFYSSCQNAT